MYEDDPNEEVFPELEGRHVVLSLSGGKDSAATAIYLVERGIPFTAVFCDTGWEHEKTYRYIEDELEPRFGPIHWLRAKSKVDGREIGMEELLYEKGMFPHRTGRFCTEELKVFPFIEFMHSIADNPSQVVNAMGIRAGESRARSKHERFSWDADFGDVYVWRPVLHWTREDVIEAHHRFNLPPNPLYTEGANRVGCWPCIFARKDEIRQVADQTPERIDKIREWEENITYIADRRSLDWMADELWELDLDLADTGAVIQTALAERPRTTKVPGEKQKVVTAPTFGGATLDEITEAETPDDPKEWIFGRQRTQMAMEAIEAFKSLDTPQDHLLKLHHRGVLEEQEGYYRTGRKGKLAKVVMQKGRTFFPGRSSTKMFEPVDSIVEWANSPTRGKSAEERRDEEAREGCMRWGMCETTPET